MRWAPLGGEQGGGLAAAGAEAAGAGAEAAGAGAEAAGAGGVFASVAGWLPHAAHAISTSSASSLANRRVGTTENPRYDFGFAAGEAMVSFTGAVA